MPEVRLIDANALAESDMAKLIDKYLYNQCNLTVGLAAALMPEIEAEPVRHGRWNQYSRNADETYIECSNCCVASRPRHLQMVTRTGAGLPDFCPNCGADMREVSKDEER